MVRLWDVNSGDVPGSRSARVRETFSGYANRPSAGFLLEVQDKCAGWVEIGGVHGCGAQVPSFPVDYLLTNGQKGINPAYTPNVGKGCLFL